MQCASIFGSTALNSSERNAIFLQRARDTTGICTSSVKCMTETEKASPPKKTHTRHHRRYTRFHRGSSRKRVSFKHTCRCVVMLCPRPCWRYAVMVSPPSLINPGVQQRAHYFRLKEPRTLLPMLVMVAMFVGFFSLRLSHEAGSSRSHPQSVEFADGHER